MEFHRQKLVVFLKRKSCSHIQVHHAMKASFLPFGIPHGPLVLELSKKSRSYFLAGGYVKATWARVKSHDARNTRSSVRKLGAISRTRHYVMNTCDGCYFTLRLQGNKKHCEVLHINGAEGFLKKNYRRSLILCKPESNTATPTLAHLMRQWIIS
ncbi:hypothetical protein L798_09093 [Zootermopsis nevadensis]|uniref:Uncharacterized protein n=1 Tax=Zootermopsis nevadensis TaxID=136037 RepID=A0A067RD64_ZOONE|nr:hypothetical protein L798_09093 [Zootermopsis nevadensis]